MKLKICRICKLNNSQVVFEKVRRICTNCRKNQINTYKKKWRANNKEKIIDDSKLYYINNKKEIDIRNTNYYFNNKEKVVPIRRKYALKNRAKLNNYKKDKRKNDNNYRISENLRSRVNSAVKRAKSKKVKNTNNLTGCTIFELKSYLESKFLPTMTWENYGSLWHIDHIIPCSKFDLRIQEEQQKCFHYTNLQPLFAITTVIDKIEYMGNINKGSKIMD